MRVFYMIGIMMAAALSARSEECAVTVLMRADAFLPMGALQRAEISSTEMFARIGVNVRWQSESDPSPDSDALCPLPITIQLDGNAPRDFHPLALAYARPYAESGTRIHVFVNRITSNHPSSVVPVLAHVLVHEIAHVLQGIACHADYGVMKARWTERDITEMRCHGLQFSSTDVRLIHQGLARANKHLIYGAIVPGPTL